MIRRKMPSSSTMPLLMNKYQFNGAALVVLGVCFLATFSVILWVIYSNYGNTRLTAPSVGLIFLGSFGLLNGSMASVRQRWSWWGWIRHVVVATLRTFPWVFVTFVAMDGVLAPFVFPGEVFSHGPVWIVAWFALGYTLGIWLFGVTTGWWILDDGSRSRGNSSWRTASVPWIAGALVGLLIGIPEWAFNSHPEYQTLINSFVFWILFLWIPIAGRIGWGLAYEIDKRWLSR